MTNAASNTFTIPTYAAVGFPVGTCLSILNLGAGATTIQGAAGVTLTGTSTTSAQYEGGVAVKSGTNSWTFVKGGGGPKASVSNTTGAPALTTVTEGDIKYVVYTFTGSVSVMFDKPGPVQVLIVAGGGGGGGLGTLNYIAGSGGGGGLLQTDFYVTAGTVPIIVGGGGVIGSPGGETLFGNLCMARGGAGGYNQGGAGGNGGSGGGAGYRGARGWAFMTKYGFYGGDTSSGFGGGAGGTGDAPTYGAPLQVWGNYYATSGGRLGAGGPRDLSPNTGNGGTGGYPPSGLSSAGASGVVIVRVRTN